MLIHPNFDPVAFSAGPLAVRWYGLMYLLAFASFWWLGTRRITAGLAPISREQLDESGRFRFVEETRVHSEERITAERLVGFALSEGSMQTLLAAGVTEQQVGLDRLRAVATTELGDEPSPWYLGYRLVQQQQQQ